MPQSWRATPLEKVLTKSEDWIALDPERSYREITVKLWGKGVILRRETFGSEIASPRRLRVRSRQFILSRIDARNGAMGLVPDSLNGGVVSNDFPAFQVNEDKMLPEYLGWMSRTGWFVDLCKSASEGTTNRVRLQEDRFLKLQIPLPPLPEQRRIEGVAGRIQSIQGIEGEIQKTTRAVMLSAYQRIIEDASWRPMAEIAPLVRRPIEIDISAKYPEVGIKSFGRGTFHKPPLEGASVGSKKLFRIETGDLLFNIVFAWEGAVAVAKPENHGRFGSHRFLTCVPKKGLATSSFISFHFLTDRGLDDLGRASPGGAGRNRTLGLTALEGINVPAPSPDRQKRFDELLSKVNAVDQQRSNATAELDALLPSVLDRAFKGEL